MFFSGRAPRPPWETRARVEALVKRWDRGHIETSADRFRFQTLQSRFRRSSISGTAASARAKKDVPDRSSSRRRSVAAAAEAGGAGEHACCT